MMPKLQLHDLEIDGLTILPYLKLFAPVAKTKLNSVALVRERTITTERPPPVGEVSTNFCG
jgi:hypothetical protein